MGRPVILGNGALTVGLNHHGLVHDFYFPYVGLENLTTARSLHHSIGVWADGRFSWIDDGSWNISVNFEDEALVSIISMKSEGMGLELKFNDFVDPRTDAFCRHIEVCNLNDQERDVRVFMHQVFQISSGGRADTALYEPEETYILDYKGRVALLIGGKMDDGTLFDQFAVGGYGVEGKEGTFRDAEDGELSGSAVEHGGVDSVIRFNCPLKPHGSRIIDYWVLAESSQQDAEKVHIKLKETGLEDRLRKTRAYWHQWLARSAGKRSNVNKKLQPWLTKSMLITKAHIDKRGGIIASCDSSIYNYGRDYYSYVWPRDGAYVLWPLIRMGYSADAKRFFNFCSDIMHPDGYMMHKYQPDRAVGSTWHPLLHGRHKELAIQEDETAVVIFMLGEFYDYCHDEEFVHELYEKFIQPAGRFMARFIDEQTGLPHASYDLWEEKFLTHTYTAAITYKALLVAARFADMFGEHDDAAAWTAAADRLGQNAAAFYDPERGTLRKGFLLNPDGGLTFDNTLDMSSAYGVFMFEYPVPKEQFLRTIKAIEDDLFNSAPVGGVPRYEYDHYFASDPPYKGNPWFVTTLWLAQYYIRVGKTAQASAIIMWCMSHADQSGALAEQVHPVTGLATGVSPLVWSHAELANAILDISER